MGSSLSIFLIAIDAREGGGGAAAHTTVVSEY
jgi:hypothetical protein